VSVASHHKRLLITALLAALVAWTARVSQVEPDALLSEDGLRSAMDILGGLRHPDLSGDFVERVWRLMLESLAIGAVGMGLALTLGVPLALVAARLPDLSEPPGRDRTRTVMGVLRWGARTVLSVLRSIPEIVWAYLFVRILGLGPGPAVLAIGLTFAGIIGKLYAELMEAVDPLPVRALRAAGVGRWAALLVGVFPQVRAQWIGYGLFRFECAIRSAAILGVVGAGGIGAEIDLSIRYFQYDKLATALLAVLACVIVFEVISAGLRRVRARWTVGALAIGLVWGLDLLAVPWADLLDAMALEQTRLFVAGLASPQTDSVFLWDSVRLMGETVAMALCATIAAAAAAFLVAPLATRTLTVSGFLPDAVRPRSWWGLPVWVALVAARLLLQVTRALPELVWALVFVVWVGPGPFAGMLAIAAHTVGILGRLFSEVYEEVEPQPVAALEALGASRIARWGYGLLPQVAPRLLAYALFRFEVNVRATAMVGFVGAGGIGNAIHTAISLFHWADLSALLLLLLGAVVVIDAVGDQLRRRLIL